MRCKNAAFPAGLLGLLVAGWGTGCANPGPPRPPSLHLPRPITDLRAERTGDELRLHWTPDAETTDGLEIKTDLIAVLCREIPARAEEEPSSSPLAGSRPEANRSSRRGAESSAQAATEPAVEAAGHQPVQIASCTPLQQISIHPSQGEMRLVLPGPEASGPPVPVDWRIRLENAAGRSAGLSNAAHALDGAAPPPVAGLRASSTREGALLEWNPEPGSFGVELTRHTVKAAPVDASSRMLPPQGKTSSDSRLRVASDRGGTLDRTARFGESYSYTAQRFVSVALGAIQLQLRGQPSAPVSVALRDTFPPAVPSGLAAIPGGVAESPDVDLSWEPVSDPDLAGYLVYRQPLAQNGTPAGPSVRLTPQPLPGPGYSDTSLTPGQRYAYRVSSVDQAGNESAPSDPVQEEIEIQTQPQTTHPHHPQEP